VQSGEYFKDKTVNAYCIYAALAFSSGVAAIMVVTNLLNAGDHILSMDDVFGG